MTKSVVEMVVVLVLAVQKNGTERHLVFVVSRTRVTVVAGLPATKTANHCRVPLSAVKMEKLVVMKPAEKKMNVLLVVKKVQNVNSYVLVKAMKLANVVGMTMKASQKTVVMETVILLMVKEIVVEVGAKAMKFILYVNLDVVSNSMIMER